MLKAFIKDGWLANKKKSVFETPNVTKKGKDLGETCHIVWHIRAGVRSNILPLDNWLILSGTEV